MFLGAAQTFGITVVESVILPTANMDFSSYLSILQEYDARIYVLIMDDIVQAGNLMSYLAENGVMNANTATFGCSILSSSKLWTQLSTRNSATVKNIMEGFFAVTVASNDWKVTARGNIFSGFCM